MIGSDSSVATEAPLTVVAQRRIRRGAEADFEQAMHEFIRFAMNFHGHDGITVLRPGAAGGDYVVVDRFHDRVTREAFVATLEYRRWMDALEKFAEGALHRQELTGLEGWFTMPKSAGVRPPPKWKMGIATFLGVFPTVVFLTVTVGPLIGNWSFLPRAAIFNACVVGLLTWVVMPLITRFLSGWLFAAEK
jgi:antibiotic biosynthesis monooxygenase (ABM) superfamily enzyme